MDAELTGKVALITGAARGIGEATARRMAELGAQVVVADVLVDEAKSVAADIGDAAIGLRLDVTSESDWAEALVLAEKTFGRINVVVSNAGVIETVAITDTSDEQFDRLVAVNLRGPFLGIRIAGKHMAERGGGVIVNVGSVVATTPIETLGAYAATKGGVASLSRVAAMELGPQGVRVCVVRPGSIATPMAHPDAVDDPFNKVLAAGRIGQPIDIAEVIAFVASDRAAFVTGSEIIVDGGWSAGRYALEVAGAATVVRASD